MNLNVAREPIIGGLHQVLILFRQIPSHSPARE